MVFHEVYSAYYLAVERMISLALAGKLNQKSAWNICNQYAFKESFELIWTAISQETWHVIPIKGNLPYDRPPTRPLTILEKRWLRAILEDPRIKLFNIDIEGLDDVEPLFTPIDWHIADRYSDGDPYDSLEYATAFRIVLRAIKQGDWLDIDMENQSGKASHVYILPQTIEYSIRDDKFRILCSPQSEVDTVNIGRIKNCTICNEQPTIKNRRKKKDSFHELILSVSDNRNGLERVMTHFSAFDKSLQRQPDGSYQLTLKYHPDEESDLVLQVLSFGTVVHVLSPEKIITAIKGRLQSQFMLPI